MRGASEADMSTQPFTRNYRDHSNDTGFQFEFFCDKCGNGHRSSYQTSGMGFAASMLRRLARCSAASVPGRLGRRPREGRTARARVGLGLSEGHRGVQAPVQAVHPMRAVGLSRGLLEPPARPLRRVCSQSRRAGGAHPGERRRRAGVDAGARRGPDARRRREVSGRVGGRRLQGIAKPRSRRARSSAPSAARPPKSPVPSFAISAARGSSRRARVSAPSAANLRGDRERVSRARIGPARTGAFAGRASRRRLPSHSHGSRILGRGARCPMGPGAMGRARRPRLVGDFPVDLGSARPPSD